MAAGPGNRVGPVILAIFAVALGAGGALDLLTTLTRPQIMALCMFGASVAGTILLWEYRIAVAFIALSGLLVTGTLDIPHLVEFASLDVILFLVCMMVVAAMAREVGFFHYLMVRLVKLSRFRPAALLAILCATSMLMAMLLDEVTSIVFVTSIVMEICAFFALDPLPLVMAAVLSTNIGSSGTVLGNPIGILIALKSGLSFEDFLRWSLPVALLSLGAVILLLLVWNRGYLRRLGEAVREKGSATDGAAAFLDEWSAAPSRREFAIGTTLFVGTLLAIAFHHRVEAAFGLTGNTMLLVMAFTGAAAVFAWRGPKANRYLDEEVDWRTLVFFMLLFAKTGTLTATGVIDRLAGGLERLGGHSLPALTTTLLWGSAAGSSVLDNVVLVAALIPLVQHVAAAGVPAGPLWWALLFGGCYGGNATMVGSTANVVALGMMERAGRGRITFLRWLPLGLAASAASLLAATGFLLLFLGRM